MVRIIGMKHIKNDGDGYARLIRAAGSSGDVKPTDVATGSKFREVDTGKTYVFNEASGSWTESSASVWNAF